MTSRLTFRNVLKKLSVIALTLASFSAIDSARAEGIYLGALGGLAIPSNNTGISNRFNWGFDAGYLPTSAFGVGAYYMNSSGDCNNTNISCAVRFYGGEATFYIPITGLSIGARVGSSSEEADFGVFGKASTNAFAWGPKFGWDTSFLVLPVAFGIEYNPMFVSGKNGSNGFTMHNADLTVRLTF